MKNPFSNIDWPNLTKLLILIFQSLPDFFSCLFILGFELQHNIKSVRLLAYLDTWKNVVVDSCGVPPLLCTQTFMSFK